MTNIEWLTDPEDQDYPAAHEALTLIMDENRANAIVTNLYNAETTTRKAKDIIRMSRLPLLPVDDKHVEKNLHKIKEGKPLSPVLLVRGTTIDDPLIVADGYHRCCAIYHLDYDLSVRCRIASSVPMFTNPGQHVRLVG